MTTVKGVFDGQSIKLLEPPPSTQPSAVTVTFLIDEDVTVKEAPAAYGTRSASGVALADLVDKVRLVLDSPTDGSRSPERRAVRLTCNCPACTESYP